MNYLCSPVYIDSIVKSNGYVLVTNEPLSAILRVFTVSNCRVYKLTAWQYRHTNENSMKKVNQLKKSIIMFGLTI